MSSCTPGGTHTPGWISLLWTIIFLSVNPMQNKCEKTYAFHTFTFVLKALHLIPLPPTNSEAHFNGTSCNNKLVTLSILGYVFTK
jgi:hypothetical protein